MGNSQKQTKFRAAETWDETCQSAVGQVAEPRIAPEGVKQYEAGTVGHFFEKRRKRMHTVLTETLR